MTAVMGSLKGIQSLLTLLQFNLSYFKRDFQCQAKASKQGLQLIKTFFNIQMSCNIANFLLNKA